MSIATRPLNTGPVAHFEYAKISDRQLLFVPFAMTSLLACSVSGFGLLMGLCSAYPLDGSMTAIAEQANLTAPQIALEIADQIPKPSADGRI